MAVVRRFRLIADAVRDMTAHDFGDREDRRMMARDEDAGPGARADLHEAPEGDGDEEELATERGDGRLACGLAK